MVGEEGGGEFMGGSKGPAPLKIRKIHIHRTKKKLFVFCLVIQ